MDSQYKDLLSADMVKNHLKYFKQHQAYFKDIVKPKVLSDKNLTRVIVIVGAGASRINGLPLGSEAIDKLIKSTSMPKEMYNAEIERLTTLYRLPQTFETILMALSSNTYVADETREKLKELYGIRFIPNLFYEILAHLLKHKFVDAIINFNFDELLDQSIEDELDKDEYLYIISDGHCPDSSALSNIESWIPIYAKPHGTISHLSTMRYTHEDYFKMPVGFKKLFTDLFSSEYETVFIVAGFSMQSFEFNLILNKINKKIRTYVLNTSDLKLSHLMDKRFINVNNYGLGNTFIDLYNNIVELFNDEYKPRDIERHKFVSNLFENDSGEDINRYKQNLQDYLYQRTIIEIYINAAKCKGIININEISEGKIGRYYDEYRKIKGYINSPSLHDLCKDLGFKNIGYSLEIMMIDSNPASNDESHITWEPFLYWAEKQYNNLNKLVPNIKKTIDDNGGFINFKSLLRALHFGDEVEIKIREIYFYNRIFNKPKVITTKTELSFLTRYLFRKNNLKYLYIIAETGEYLMSLQNIILEGKRDVLITLIVADTTYIRSLKIIYGKNLKSAYKLYWWKHNRHMTIGCDEKEEAICSIYFQRRQKGSQINPVFLEGADTIYIKKIFDQYKEKSEPIKLIS